MTDRLREAVDQAAAGDLPKLLKETTGTLSVGLDADDVLIVAQALGEAFVAGVKLGAVEATAAAVEGGGATLLQIPELGCRLDDEDGLEDEGEDVDDDG